MCYIVALPAIVPLIAYRTEFSAAYRTLSHQELVTDCPQSGISMSVDKDI
jgi:hypothetical protein